MTRLLFLPQTSNAYCLKMISFFIITIKYKIVLNSDFTQLPIEFQDEAKRRADYAIAVMEATRFKRSTKEASKAINKRFKKKEG